MVDSSSASTVPRLLPVGVTRMWSPRRTLIFPVLPWVSFLSNSERAAATMDRRLSVSLIVRSDIDPPCDGLARHALLRSEIFDTKHPRDGINGVKEVGSSALQAHGRSRTLIASRSSMAR